MFITKNRPNLKVIIQFIGVVLILLQLMMYTSEHYHPDEVRFVHGDITFVEVEKIDFFLLNPLSTIGYGLKRGSPDRIISGLIPLMANNMFMLLGIILVFYRNIYRFIKTISSKISNKIISRLNLPKGSFIKGFFLVMKIENEGYKRIFIVISSSMILFCWIWGTVDAYDPVEGFFGGLILGIMLFIGWCLIVRLGIWIYDGFKKS